MKITEQNRRDAKILWDYHKLSQPLPQQVDLLLVLGSHDYRVAEYAATLVGAVSPRFIVVTGGHGKVTKNQQAAEADIFAEIMINAGVDASRIRLERLASNTGENFTFSHALLEQEGIHVTTGSAVTKPYMERRVLATAEKQWPQIQWSVSSPPISFEDYPEEGVPEERAIGLMVGDLQRIKLYGEQGLQSPQDIPVEVWWAYERLAGGGFDQYLIHPDTP